MNDSAGLIVLLFFISFFYLIYRLAKGFRKQWWNGGREVLDHMEVHSRLTRDLINEVTPAREVPEDQQIFPEPASKSAPQPEPETEPEPAATDEGSEVTYENRRVYAMPKDECNTTAGETAESDYFIEVYDIKTMDGRLADEVLVIIIDSNGNRVPGIEPKRTPRSDWERS